MDGIRQFVIIGFNGKQSKHLKLQRKRKSKDKTTKKKK